MTEWRPDDEGMRKVELPAELIGGPMDGQRLNVPCCPSDKLPLQFLKVTYAAGPDVVRQARRTGISAAKLAASTLLVGAYERDRISDDTHHWRYLWLGVDASRT